MQRYAAQCSDARAEKVRFSGRRQRRTRGGAEKKSERLQTLRPGEAQTHWQQGGLRHTSPSFVAGLLRSAHYIFSLGIWKADQTQKQEQRAVVENSLQEHSAGSTPTYCRSWLRAFTLRVARGLQTGPVEKPDSCTPLRLYTPKPQGDPQR